MSFVTSVVQAFQVSEAQLPKPENVIPDKQNRTTALLLAGLLTTSLLLTSGRPAGATDATEATAPPAGAEVVTATAPARATVRNPFAEAVPRRDGIQQPGEAEKIVFDGTARQLTVTMGSLRRRTLPKIKVRGIMEVAGKVVACAEVGNIGTVVLRANERVLLGNQGNGPRPEDVSAWFLVRVIDRSGMTIELDDGTLVQGRFF